MKILFFFNGDFQEGNAAHARFIAYGKGLNSLGFQNCFYVIRPSEFGDSGINTYAKGQVQGVNYAYLGGETKRRKTISGRLLRLSTAWRSSLNLLSNENPTSTVLYFYGAQLITHAPILLFGKLFGFKIIIEQTELHSLKVESTRIKTTFSKFNNGIVESTIPFWADALLLTSRRLMLFYKRRFPNFKVQKLPVVFDDARFKVSQKKEYRIGYLGSFANKDGVEGIIKAYADTLKAHQGQIKLRLIGYQTSSFNLDSELAKYGFCQEDKFIEATGQVKTDDIPNLLSECDLLLMNRISDNFANYGFPIKLAEYMATGRPVICTDVSDISYYFIDGEDCRIIKPENTETLTKAILDRYEKYEEYSLMGLKGKKKAHSLFQYKQHVESITQLAKKLIS